MTLMKEREEVAVLWTAVPVQLLFGGCPVDPDLVDVYGPEPRWDIATIDEVLEARCASL